MECPCGTGDRCGLIRPAQVRSAVIERALTGGGTSSTAVWARGSGRRFSACPPTRRPPGCSARSWRSPSCRPTCPTGCSAPGRRRPPPRPSPSNEAEGQWGERRSRASNQENIPPVSHVQPSHLHQFIKNNFFKRHVHLLTSRGQHLLINQSITSQYILLNTMRKRKPK